MPDLTTETRTFVGETGTRAFDGMAGFRLGQAYELRIERRVNGEVAIRIEHAHAAPGRELVVNEAEFEKWFQK